MNHFYQSIVDESYFSFEDFYSRVAKRFPSGLFAEIGVLHGKSLAFLAVECIRNGGSPVIHAVDSFRWNDDQLANFKKNLDPLVGHVDLAIHVGESVEVAKHFPDQCLDVVFIDANHSYGCVRDDIKAWLPKVKKGGVIAGHDYSPDSFPGCVQAVDEAFGGRVKLSHYTAWEVDV